MSDQTVGKIEQLTNTKSLRFELPAGESVHITHEAIFESINHLVVANEKLVDFLSEDNYIPVIKEIRENCLMIKNLLQHSFDQSFQKD